MKKKGHESVKMDSGGKKKEELEGVPSYACHSTVHLNCEVRGRCFLS